jgi:D-glycero-D-manno-heptose 1,7-bisphosphate phosphatase
MITETTKKFRFNANKPKSLFLDRDGVINISPKGLYVSSWSEFKFEEKALEALRFLSHYFDYVFVITNQRGVGKNVMKEESLIEIHRNMCNEIITHGGRVDKVYYCTDVDYNSMNLKPNSGMAYQAKSEFKEVSFENSIMIGDQLSDIEFGKRLNMKTILIDKTELKVHDLTVDCDMFCKNLMDVVSVLGIGSNY